MRIRSILPDFYRSQDIADLDWHTRLVFIGLWSYVDDNGVGRDNERLVSSDLFPLDGDPTESLRRVSTALQTLSTGGQIQRYTVDGVAYLFVVKWDKYQRVQNPGKERYPRPTCDNVEPTEILPRVSVDPPETLSPGEGEKGRRGEGEKGASRRKPTTAIPADWAPNDKHKEQAQTKGIDLDYQATRFRNWAEAKDQRYADWDAAFRNWLASDINGGSRPARAAGKPKDQLAW